MIITEKDRQILQIWRQYKHSDGPYSSIAQVLLLFELGYSRNRISRETDYSYSRVCDFIRLYKEGGMEAIIPKPNGRPHKDANFSKNIYVHKLLDI